MGLSEMRDEYQVKWDVCRDAYLEGKGGVRLFDDGANWVDVWAMETFRPVRTAQSLVERLEGIGIRARVGQMGDREVIVKAWHGRDAVVYRKILGVVFGRKRKRLSEEHKAKLRKHLSKIRKEGGS